ncbi:MAG: class E sortase [Candidatus Paceibacterota bacterium]|jgi:LPXTG-site transpeptidase (sortase) family protein
MAIRITKKVGGLIFFLLIFLVATIIFHFILNGGAYWKKIRYDIFLRSPLASADLAQNDILKFGQGAVLPGMNFRLIIPKIEIDVPIISPQNSSTAAVLAAMEDGTALYQGSSEPGEKGRSVILGHSSRATWYRGNYATVFSLISQLNVGDMFYILTQDKKFTYRVFRNQVLSPYQANQLFAGPVVYGGMSNQNLISAGSEIDLVTCYPVGSASNRTVIQAELIATMDL